MNARMLIAIISLSSVGFAASEKSYSGFPGNLIDEVKKVADPIIAPLTKISIDVWNHTSDDLKVVMDSDREIHIIPGNHHAVFTEANFGDMPTFRFLDIHGKSEYKRCKLTQTGHQTIDYPSFKDSNC